MTDFDELLGIVGDFGQYQLVMYFLICLPASIPSAWTAFNQGFVAAVPLHWCRVPELEGRNLSIVDRINYTAPLTREQKFSQCYQYNLNYSEFDFNTFNHVYPPNVTQIPCQNGYEYDHSTYDSTIVTEFNLVCKQDFWPSFSTMMFYIGSFIGNILFGYIADRWGRRPAFFAILAIQVGFGTANAFAPNIYIFTALRFMVGLSFPALYQIPFIIGLELIGPSKRIFAGMVVCIIFGVAMSLLGIVASFIRAWSLLIIVCNAPFAILFTYWLFLPESPRWLVSEAKFEEATKTLSKIAKWNKKNIDSVQIRRLCERVYQKTITGSEELNRHNLLDLFKTPNIRIKTLLITYIWRTLMSLWTHMQITSSCFFMFVNALVYNGLTLNIANLEVNDYLSFTINGAVEIPAYLLSWPLLARIGRRWPLCLSMLLGGLACASTMFVPADEKWVISGLAFVGKFGIAASFGIIYIFAGELYPTVLRALGMGMSSMVAGTGLIIAPYLIYLGSYSRILPLLIMGGFTVSAGVMAMFLPETLGKPLPQTVEDAELFRSTAASFFSMCSFNKKRTVSNENQDHKNLSDAQKPEELELMLNKNGPIIIANEDAI